MSNIGNSVPFQDAGVDIEEEDEDKEEEADSMCPKDSVGKIMWFAKFAFIPFYLTLPDVKNSEFTILPSFKVPGKQAILQLQKF